MVTACWEWQKWFLLHVISDACAQFHGGGEGKASSRRGRHVGLQNRFQGVQDIVLADLSERVQGLKAANTFLWHQNKHILASSSVTTTAWLRHRALIQALVAAVCQCNMHCIVNQNVWLLLLWICDCRNLLRRTNMSKPAATVAENVKCVFVSH